MEWALKMDAVMRRGGGALLSKNHTAPATSDISVSPWTHCTQYTGVSISLCTLSMAWVQWLLSCQQARHSFLNTYTLDGAKDSRRPWQSRLCSHQAPSQPLPHTQSDPVQAGGVIELGFDQGIRSHVRFVTSRHRHDPLTNLPSRILYSLCLLPLENLELGSLIPKRPMDKICRVSLLFLNNL